MKLGVIFIQNTLHQVISGEIIPITTKIGMNGSINEVRIISPLIPIKFKLGQWIYEKLAYLLYKIYVRKFGAPDIIHAQGYLAAIMANYISQRTETKYIITEHANDILKDSLLPGIRKKVKSAYENSHKLISVGHLLKKRNVQINRQANRGNSKLH
ncbi:MAG: hypothetical protein IPI60_19735 [Saprospiraceae bacterium]|nr:hypothetical protein [Saprospiraceae bacterium]